MVAVGVGKLPDEPTPSGDAIGIRLALQLAEPISLGDGPLGLAPGATATRIRGHPRTA